MGGLSSLTMWGGWGSRFIVVGFCVGEDLEVARRILTVESHIADGI